MKYLVGTVGQTKVVLKCQNTQEAIIIPQTYNTIKKIWKQTFFNWKTFLESKYTLATLI